MTLSEKRDRAIECYNSNSIEKKLLGDVWRLKYIFAGGKRNLNNIPGRITKYDDYYNVTLLIMFTIRHCRREINKYWDKDDELRRIMDRVGSRGKYNIPEYGAALVEYTKIEMIEKTKSYMTVALMTYVPSQGKYIVEKTWKLYRGDEFINGVHKMIADFVAKHVGEVKMLEAYRNGNAIKGKDFEVEAEALKILYTM